MVQREMQSSSMNEDELEQLQNDILERLAVEKPLSWIKHKTQVSADDEIFLLLLSNPGFEDAAGDFSRVVWTSREANGFGSKASTKK